MISLLVMVGRQFLHAIIGQLLLFVVLCSAVKFDFYLSVECFYFNIWSEASLTNWYKYVCVYVETFSLKQLMRFHFNSNHKITRRTSWTGSVATFWYSQVDAIVNTFRYIHCLAYCLMHCSSTTASHTWATDHLTFTTTVSTYLLNHKWSLSNSLETLTSAGTTCWWWGSWFALRPLTCFTSTCPTKCDCFSGTLNRFHKINLQIQLDILALALLSGSLAASFSSLWTTTKHFLKFIEYVTKSLLSSSSAEVLLESCETLTATTKWISAHATIGLALFVTSHASLIIYTPFWIIT